MNAWPQRKLLRTYFQVLAAAGHEGRGRGSDHERYPGRTPQPEAGQEQSAAPGRCEESEEVLRRSRLTTRQLIFAALVLLIVYYIDSNFIRDTAAKRYTPENNGTRPKVYTLHPIYRTTTTFFISLIFIHSFFMLVKIEC